MSLTKQKLMGAKTAVSGKMKKTAVAICAGLSTVSPAFASIDPDEAGRSALGTIFNILMFGGIVIFAVGVVMVGKAISEGENAPPGAIGKGTAMIIGGLIFAFAKVFTEKLLGIQIDSFSFFG